MRGTLEFPSHSLAYRRNFTGLIIDEKLSPFIGAFLHISAKQNVYIVYRCTDIGQVGTVKRMRVMRLSGTERKGT